MAEIVRCETITSGHVGVVTVETADGAQGVGQLSPYNADLAAEVFHKQVAPHALGADESDLEALVEKIPRAEYKFTGSYVRRALTGLDTALWDLRGKRADEPVYALLGGEDPDPIPAYGSSMSREITPEEEAARLARLKKEAGFEAFKIRVGSAMGQDEDQWPGRTEEIVPAVREAVGDDVDIYVDANGCYSAERAIEVGEEVLAPNDVVHYEEPCPFWNLDDTEQVRNALDIPVAGGEQDYMLPQWRRIIERPVVDIVQPDVCYLGGITRTLQVAEWAEEAGLPFVPHAANHSLVQIFTLHLLAAVEGTGPYMEFSIEDSWADGLYKSMPEAEDGAVAVPDGPGWGVSVNWDWFGADAEREVSSR